MKEVYVIRDNWHNYGEYEEHETGIEVYGIYDDFQKAKEAAIELINGWQGPSKRHLFITPESTFEEDGDADLMYLECGIVYFGVPDDDDGDDEEYYKCIGGYHIHRHDISIIEVPINEIDIGGLV